MAVESSSSPAQRECGIPVNVDWHLHVGRRAASMRSCPCWHGRRRSRPHRRAHRLPRAPRLWLRAPPPSRRVRPAWRDCARPRCACWARCCGPTRCAPGARCWRPAARRTCALRLSARRYAPCGRLPSCPSSCGACPQCTEGWAQKASAVTCRPSPVSKRLSMDYHSPDLLITMLTASALPCGSWRRTHWAPWRPCQAAPWRPQHGACSARRWRARARCRRCWRLPPRAAATATPPRRRAHNLREAGAGHRNLQWQGPLPVSLSHYCMVQPLPKSNGRTSTRLVPSNWRCRVGTCAC